VRTAIAATQLALSMTLLVGALLFIGTLNNLRALETGFDADRLMTVAFGFRQQGYDSARIEAFFSGMTTGLAARPEITDVAVGSGVPQFGGEIYFNVRLPGDSEPRRVPVSGGSPEYFATLALPIIAGRGWTHAEAQTPQPPVVISESLARQAFGNVDAALGEQVGFGQSSLIPGYDAAIVGVARDVLPENLREAPEPAVYRPIYRYSQSNQWLIVRAADAVGDALQQVRQASRAIDPALAVTPTLMEDRLSVRLGTERLMAWTMGFLAVLGFAVAAVGLHGLMSQAALQRRREFGVRLALGARRAHVIWLVLRSTFAVVLIGVTAGLVMTLTGVTWIRGLLFGITPIDPATYALATGALAGVVIVTGLLPAITASRVDPVETLRFE
jgi:predicted permease